MSKLKTASKQVSANGLILQEWDIVVAGEQEYLAILEDKKLVLKRFNAETNSFRYLQNWTGREIIKRVTQGENVLTDFLNKNNLYLIPSMTSMQLRRN